MKCRQCGTEIADRAIVCYRCGTPTTEARRKPAAVRARRPRLGASTVALILLAIAAAYMSQAAAGDVPPHLSWVVAGLAVLVLVLRLLRR